MSETKRLLLTAVQAAEMLQVSRQHVYELTQRGQLPVVRLGRAVWIPLAALEQWITNGGTMQEVGR
jgi:excisionase family DNA binding protein